MRYLGIDYGLKRLGLAICDAGEVIVSPLAQLAVDSRHPERLLEQLRELIQAQKVEALVVGLPLNMDDSEGPQAKVTRQFAAHLAEKLQIPVHFQDERLSSAAADEKLNQAGLTSRRRKERRDMLAACEILQEFLDQR